ncbi:hypothetical protein HYT25_00605 [Candidatus Pacearchaeota archaeon]|nr:hypothetical protein [Candidatus Pacearchaeota archaeon]
MRYLAIATGLMITAGSLFANQEMPDRETQEKYIAGVSLLYSANVDKHSAIGLNDECISSVRNWYRAVVLEKMKLEDEKTPEEIYSIFLEKCNPLIKKLKGEI